MSRSFAAPRSVAGTMLIPRVSVLVRFSLLTAGLLSIVATSAALAQPGVRAPAILPARDSLVLPIPGALAPFGALAPRRTGDLLAAEYEHRLRRILALRHSELRRTTFPRAQNLARFPTPDPSLAPMLQPPLPPGPEELTLSLNARLESRAERGRDETCSSNPLFNVSTSCQSFFQPTFALQFDVRSAGAIADRFHVDVDFDSQREFDASNDISARYEGRPGEMLQRIEVGNVTFLPAPSRFITSGIPSGNYGVQALGAIAGWRLSAIAAQQKGHVVQDRVYTVGGTALQTVDRELQDQELEQRRFFFTVDPARFGSRYPNIDILNRAQMAGLAASLPDQVRPVRVSVYRLLIGGRPINPNGPRFRLNGVPTSRRGEIYELLRENVDYYMDPSQLWFALVRPLSQNTERLVVAYTVRVAGVEIVIDSIGGTPDVEFRAEDQVANLVWDPGVQPGDAAFQREIRSVYRVGGSDVLRRSVAASVVTGTGGDQERPADGRADTYLQLFGLAERTNSAVFDVENRLWPRPADPNSLIGGLVNLAIIRDHFLVFPSLEPFAARGLAGSLGNPINDTLYRTPSEDLYSERSPAPRYRVRIRYEKDDAVDAGTIALGAVQIRQASERVTMDGRALVRGVDYEMDYDLGQLRLLRAGALSGVPRQISVRFEEVPLFASVPTSIFGAAAELPMEHGTIAFTALSQQQRTVFTRPPLGFEPAAGMLAGVSGAFAFDAGGLSRVLQRLPGARGDTLAASRVLVQAEFATSRPRNDQDAQAFLESFEGQGGIRPQLTEAQWYLSSQPARSPALDATTGPSGLTLDRAATLAWQSNGRTAAGELVSFSIEQIDPLIESVGSGFFLPEPTLWLTMHPLRVGGLFLDGQLTRPRWTIANAPQGQRWRSLRTRLGAAGTDLTRVEAIEFWTLVDIGLAGSGRNPTLVFDFGDVSENTVSVAPDTLRVFQGLGGLADTVYTGRRIVGLDTLDSEIDPFTRSFNAARDDVGLPGDVSGPITIIGSAAVRDSSGVTLCRRGPQQLFRLGDPQADCTASNNRADTEDLDGDEVLDLESAQRDAERIRRFVVRLDDPARQARLGRCNVVVDPSAGTGATGQNLCWVLVRVPWSAADDSLNGGPSLRRVRALRVTILSGPTLSDAALTQVPIVRLRLVGAPWTKRSDRVSRGLGGDVPGRGLVTATVIGTQDRDASGLQYEPPPGVGIVPASRLTGAEGDRQQVTEQSMRILATDLAEYERAEAYYRFPEGEKNFLGYRELRLWARGRGRGWQRGAELQFFIKVGRDNDNFYLYRTPVGSGFGQAAWEPEVRVDLQRFSRLRARIQNAYLRNDPARIQCTGLDSALVAASPLPIGATEQPYAACDDGYIAYTVDPNALPPNLAAVQEMAVGMVRVDTAAGGDAIIPGDTLELWVNEIRLARVNSVPGYAGQMEVALEAGGFGQVRLTAGRRDPYFRQLGEQPSFLTDDAIEAVTTLNVDRLLPASLGISLPVTVRHRRAAADPFFISGADYAADDVLGLRTPSSSVTSYIATVRRRTPVGGSPLNAFLDHLSASALYTTANTRSEFRRGTARDLAASLDFDVAAAARTSPLPEWLHLLLGGLPLGIGESAFVRSLRETQLRWNPARFRVSSGIVRSTDRRVTFLLPAAAFSDSGRSVAGLDRLWRTTAQIEMRPLNGLSLRWDAASIRDLRDYGDTSSVSLALTRARRAIFGLDAGMERERNMGGAIDINPQLEGWVRPRFSASSRYDMLRDPNHRFILPDPAAEDDARVPRRVGNDQTIATGVALDLGTPLRDLMGGWAIVNAIATALRPIDISYTRTLRSDFDATPFAPGFGYQFGLGGVGAFRSLGDDLATFAGQSAEVAAVGSAVLPFGASVTTRFARTRGRNFTRQALPEQRIDEADQVTFPDVAVRWNWQPSEPGSAITSVSADARAVHTRQVGVARAEAGAGLRETRDTNVRSYPVGGTIVWAFAGLSTSASWTRGEREDNFPGTSIRSHSDDLSGDIGRTFTLPSNFDLQSGVRTRFAVHRSRAQSFAIPASDPTNRSRLVDNGRTAFSLSADTDVAENLTFVLQGSRIVTFDDNLNRRLQQTLVSAALQLQFFSGVLR